MRKPWYSISNLLNSLLFAAVLLMIFNPSAKALAIRGLMNVGLFQPDINHPVDKKLNAVVFPDVVFKSTQGTLLHLADLKGKVIFINFWATWCPPCIAEMPSIQKLYEKLQSNKNIVFIMVDADSDFQKSVPFMAKHHYTAPLFMPAGNVPPSLASNSIPTTTIIDRTGKVVFSPGRQR